MATAPDFQGWLALRGLGLLLACAVRLGGGAVAGAADAPAPPPGTEAMAAEHARLERLAAVYAAYYRRRPEVPARLLRLGLSADDVSVVLFIAEKGVADPYAIASARSARKIPWHAIMRAHRVRLSALAVRLDGPRPKTGPYARAYRVLAGQTAGPLTDDEVRDLVQLRLVTRHFGVRPSRVLARRAAGVRATALVLEADRRRPETPATAAKGGRS